MVAPAPFLLLWLPLLIQLLACNELHAMLPLLPVLSRDTLLSRFPAAADAAVASGIGCSVLLCISC
jgi:hypothetical protein